MIQGKIKVVNSSNSNIWGTSVLVDRLFCEVWGLSKIFKLMTTAKNISFFNESVVSELRCWVNFQSSVSWLGLSRTLQGMRCSLWLHWTWPSSRTSGCRMWRSGTSRASRLTRSWASWRGSGWTMITIWCTPSPPESPSSARWGSTPSRSMSRSDEVFCWFWT